MTAIRDELAKPDANSEHKLRRAQPDDPANSERKPRRVGRRVSLYLSPGQRIADRYEVLRVVGEGGMGVVYACRDNGGELCALKRVVLPEANADESLAWFVAEAQALAALNHENIVRARDFGQLRDGTPYLVMDLVEGVSLQQILGEPLDFKLLWLLIDQMLAALAHAHARGIVHGDLKPANVVVDFEERGSARARLFDFGLAKRRRMELDPRLGQRGAPAQPPSNAGTPGYMAPEQLLGRASEISSATDLYALGCILYRVIAGSAPLVFDGDAPRDFQAFRAPPRPAAPEHLPEALVDFVLSLLVEKPWQRVASAAEVRRRWQDFRPEVGSSADIVLAVRGAHDGAEPFANQETTRRVEPTAPKPQLFRLCRSSLWPPGLLGIRPSPLVGRAEQCRMLRETYERVADGEELLRAALVLSGPAGVGKSRLADHLCTLVEEQGTGVALRGYRPHQYRGREPLALALADRFELGSGALRILPSGLVHRCDEGDLGSVVDWVLCSSDPMRQRRPHDPGLPGCLARVLAAIAGSRVLVLWLDDLHEVGSETLAMLAELPRCAPALRVLVLTSARPEALSEAAAASALRGLKDALSTEFLRVPPLDSLAASAMLRAAHPIDPSLALELALSSGGIPLDALQSLHTLARRGKFP